MRRGDPADDKAHRDKGREIWSALVESGSPFVPALSGQSAASGT